MIVKLLLSEKSYCCEELSDVHGRDMPTRKLKFELMSGPSCFETMIQKCDKNI